MPLTDAGPSYNASAAPGGYGFQARLLADHIAVYQSDPRLSGMLIWALRDFAVNPGWTGGAALPREYPTDGLNHKGLLGYDGTEKPAFAVASSLFEQIPAFAR